MIIGGTAYYELLRDNYKPRGGKWVKMTKEEAKAYDNDPDINKIFANNDSDDSSSESEYVDIDEFVMTKTAIRFSYSRLEICNYFPNHTIFTLVT